MGGESWVLGSSVLTGEGSRRSVQNGSGVYRIRTLIEILLNGKRRGEKINFSRDFEEAYFDAGELHAILADTPKGQTKFL